MTTEKKKPVLSFNTAEIISNQEISPGVFVINFERNFSFKAGQVIAVKLKSDDTHRLYSIASGEGDDHISLLFDVNPDGLLTPHLANLSKGNAILHSQPLGFFTDNEDPAWWIATGTGIAPFISMYRSMDARHKVLIHGGRKKDSFYFQNEFENGNLKQYIRCSSADRGEGIYHGRLTKWLKNQPYFNPEIKYFLCGNSEMVVEVRDFLISKGIPFEKIRAEIYF